MKILKGKIISEVGQFSQWMEKLEKYYSFKTGVKLFPATLQIQVEEKSPIPSVTLENFNQSSIPCYINGAEGMVVASTETGVIYINPTTQIRQLSFGEEVEVAIPMSESVQS
jgi:hypothetical protein